MRRSLLPGRLLGLLGLFTSAPTDAVAPGEQAYSVALHLHGSLSEGIGSMEWHAGLAQQAGVDLLWWTDHDWRVEHWNHMTHYDFENATVEVGYGRVKEPDEGLPLEFRYWTRTGTPLSHSAAIVDSVAIQGSKSLRLEIADPNHGSTLLGVAYAQDCSRKQNMYSLAKRVRLAFSILPESLDPVDGKFVLQVKLSEHPGITHVLRYVAGSMEGEGPASTALAWVPGQWNSYEVDVTADAITHFTSGGTDSLRAEDNNLWEVQAILYVRGAQPTVVFLDDYRILSDAAMGGPQILDKSRDFAALYETMYPAVSHFVGCEISRYPGRPHLNGYAPDVTLIDYTGHTSADSIYWAVDQIHEQDGAVSLNHVYGVSGYGNLAETEAQKDLRVAAKKRELIAVRGWGCDVLEAGYRVRQGIDLARFLSTWDAVTGNAIFMTGNGVSDSHGSDAFPGWGPWEPGNVGFENNFVTWLYSTSLDEAGLIRAMRSGRAFFGDPYVFDPDGTLDLWTAEGFPMGRVVLTDRSSHQVIVEIDGLPSTSTVRFLQAEIRDDPPVEYIDPNYLRDELLSGTWSGTMFTDTVTVDTTVPSFVRVEVDDQGTATAYSNWLAFVTEVPSPGVKGPRVAAVLGQAKVVRADEFTLTGASYTEGAPSVLTIQGDEETAGLGTLEIDTGTLGAPTSVTGGGYTSTTYQNGLLTLVGLSGSGSTVAVEWGGTGAFVPSGRVDRLSLSVGRPNPFGRGTVAEFALPRPSTVFLEVLDVQGRRVRLLLDERRETGSHRVSWDGRDSSGRSVANGVYFLRLTAMGETLTTKAVRIR